MPSVPNSNKDIILLAKDPIELSSFKSYQTMNKVFSPWNIKLCKTTLS